ncbi:recombination endonuclease [Pectobacterium phage POP12]|nr:recombination endonuclease [Pectobacterium phage POP12]
MKLEFQKIKYSNIMSVGNAPIEIDFTEKKKMLVVGTNGTGKSTLIESLTYALFGKPFRDFKVGQLVNSVNKKKLLVELWLTYGKDKFYIKRGQKPKVFEVWKNDEKLPEDASTGDYQEQLEQMLNMNMVGFKQVIVLGTAGYTPFMNLKTPERRKLVEDLLSVSVLSQMDKLNKGYQRSVNQQLETMNMQQQHIQNEINTHQRFINEQKQLIAEQAGKTEQNIQNFVDMYDSHVETAKTLKAKIQELQLKIAEVVIQGEDQTENLAKLRDGLTKLELTMSQLTKLKVMYEKGGECPSCKQAISPTPERMQEIADKLKAGTQRVTLIKTKQSQLQEIMNGIIAQQNEIRSYRSQHDGLKLTLQNEVQSAKKIQTHIDALKAEQEKEKSVIVIDEQPLIDLQKKSDSFADQRGVLVKEKYYRGIVVDMLKDSGVKASIVKKYIPYFNKQIEYYLDLLGADYTFVLDEEFNESIKSFGRDDFSYNSFSEGEKARINIALLFTWRSVSSKISGVDLSLLILDEIFDSSIDADGASAINSILATVDGNVVVISHRELDGGNFDATIKMKKVGRFTTMVKNDRE